jgi:LmbE family N-acetylglucosaminyl deacetylase
MLSLLPQFSNRKKPQILLLGAHSDDIEIGCGGTVLRLAEDASSADVHWVVFSAIGEREGEARASAEDFLSAFANVSVSFHQFRDTYFPDDYGALKDRFTDLANGISPDVIFTHYRKDLHQDHRTISDLTWNAFRDHLILEYEIPKYDGDIGNPNFFVSVPENVHEMKVDKLLRHFASQRGKEWFSEDLLQSIMRLRGMESRSPSGYAEAFYCRKVIFSWTSSDP